MARQPVSADTIREILSFISANCDRPYWVRILAGIKDELGDAGEDIAREWSQSAPDRFNEADFKSTWRSLQPGKGITIATVIHEAKQHGYRPNVEERRTDPAEIARYRKEQAEAAQKKAAEDEAKHAAAREAAIALLNDATGDPSTHPYIVRKGGISLGPHVKRGPWPQRGWTDALLLPIFQPDAKAWSIEAIPAEEGVDKDSLKGGKRIGGIYPIGKISRATRVIVAEGAASAAACHKATGLPAVAAGSCGMLEAAARTVLKLSPNAEIIFAADFDPKADGLNPGLKAALAAATEIGGRIAIPNLDGRKCDFWDVLNERGAEAVSSAIQGARMVADEAKDSAPAPGDRPSDGPPPSHDEYESMWPAPLDLEALAKREPERPSFIIQDWGPSGYAWLLAGHGGVGKSGIALHLAVCMAAGIPFFGLDVERRRVCYLSCEDREDVLHWRLSRICAYLGVNLSDLRDWLDVFDLVSSDSVLWERDAKDGTTLRAAYFELQAQVRRNGGDVVLFVDGITDTYAGNENAKPEVKRYVRSLIRLIDPKRGAVLLIGHIAKPAAAGEVTSEGYSGTTAWHNSVRARWYLYPETQRNDDGGKAERTGELVLELQKSNHGGINQSMRFAWDEAAHLFVGQLVTETAFDRKHQAREEQAGILASLRTCAAAGIQVPAATTGQRTAYHVLAAAAEFPDALKGAGADKRRRFWRHIEAMRHAGEIREAEHRKADRKIVLTLLPRH